MLPVAVMEAAVMIVMVVITRSTGANVDVSAGRVSRYDVVFAADNDRSRRDLANDGPSSWLNGSGDWGPLYRVNDSLTHALLVKRNDVACFEPTHHAPRIHVIYNQ